MSHIKLTSGVVGNRTIAYKERSIEEEIELERNILLDVFQDKMNQIFHPAYILLQQLMADMCSLIGLCSR